MQIRENLENLRRDERGGTALTIASTILGVLIAIFGLIMLAMCISFMGDGDFGISIFIGSFAACCVAGGVLLCILPHKLVAAERSAAANGAPTQATTHTTTRTYTTTTTNATGPEIISRETIAGDPNAPVTPVVVPPDVTEHTTSSGGRAADGEKSPTEEVANLVRRSDNVVATLKDLVNHEAGSLASPHRHLASMLTAAGLMDWEDAPSFGGGRLSRNHHYWLRLNTDDLDDEQYDRLISIEAALSVNQDLANLAANSTVEESRGEVPSYVMGALTRQEIKPYDATDDLSMAYPDTRPEDTPGEWFVHSSFASACECAVTPFRVVYDHRVNVAEHLLVATLEIPRPACMAIFTNDPMTQVALARSYAIRLATLLAQQALSLENHDGVAFIDTVVINCHERGKDETILSVRFDRDLVARLRKVLDDGSALETNGFPKHEAIHAVFGPDGWFTPVEAFITLTDEQVSPSWRFIYPELVDRAVSERMTAVTGVQNVTEFGINENAVRLFAWEELARQKWESTTEAVSALVKCRDTTDDITVAEACNRTIEALLAGSVDSTDQEKLQKLFVHDTALALAVNAANAALDESEGPDHPEKAVSCLTEALAPIESLGAYLDDADTVYRYFGSIAERVRFAADYDHRRAVRLVPDEYYNALSCLSIAYDELDNQAEALRYAEEMMRIAPVSIHAALRKVRVLEHQSRIFEAADLIKSILRYACTPRDAAVCHYRLAYMEWKLGREDLAVACYQRSLKWDTEMSQQAREELDDLLNANNDLHRFSDDEVCSLLAKEGIPLGCDESDKRRTQAASVLCTDEGIFWGARGLVSVLFGITGDDVQMGVYRSLAANN